MLFVKQCYCALRLLYLTKDKFCHFEDLVGGANDDYLDARFKSGSLYYFKGLTKSSKTCYCLEKGLLARKYTNTGFKGNLYKLMV